VDEAPIEPVMEPPWWPPAKTTGRRRQPLTRDAIVEAAVKVLDAEGVDALTVRRIGQELGTGSATLYWYIGSKDELGELVYDRVMGEVELPELDAGHWQEQLKELCRRVYRVLVKHNDVARLSLGRIPAGPNMLRVMERTTAVLREAGIDGQAIGYIGDVVGRYLDASALETRMQTGPPPETVGAYFQSLPAEQFPHLHAMSRAMVAGSDDDRFEFGLDLLMRGLASYVAEHT
jgi:AcrR family transcriptional regulator